MKEIRIVIPEGYEIDKEKSTLEHIILKKCRIKPQWNTFGYYEGFFINASSEIEEFVGVVNDTDKNVLPSVEYCEAFIALYQLINWRDKYNEGWKAEWYAGAILYWGITFYTEKPVLTQDSFKRILFFKSHTIANKFLEDFEDLIKIAEPLL